MKFAVCLKQVPDTTDLKLDPETNTLIREGVEAVLNPLDEFPLEAALRLREECGGTVTAVTMGPPQAARVLEKAIAMGADDAVLASDRAFAGADTWATSLALAKTMEACGPFDVILCGKQAIDGDTAQVGPGIAAHLGIPQVTYVTKIGWVAGRLHLARLFDHGTVTVAVAPPVVLTVLKEANEPRLPTLAGRLRSLELTPRVMTCADLALDPAAVGLKGSPTRVVRIDVPKAKREKILVGGAPPDMARQLVAALRERGLSSPVATIPTA